MTDEPGELTLARRPSWDRVPANIRQAWEPLRRQKDEETVSEEKQAPTPAVEDKGYEGATPDPNPNSAYTAKGQFERFIAAHPEAAPEPAPEPAAETAPETPNEATEQPAEAGDGTETPEAPEQPEKANEEAPKE